MADWCTIGRIARERVTYYEKLKSYVVTFPYLLVGEQEFDNGFIYFEKDMVHNFSRDWVEISLCHENYLLHVTSNGCKEVISISWSAIANSQFRYYRKYDYMISVSQKTIRPGSVRTEKSVLMDLPVPLWNVAKNKGCFVDISSEQIIMQNYNSRAAVTFGSKEEDVNITFTYLSLDGRWEKETVPVKRFLSLVIESKEKKKELGLY